MFVNDVRRISTHKEHLNIRPYLLYLIIHLFAVLLRHYYVKEHKLDFILIALNLFIASSPSTAVITLYPNSSSIFLVNSLTSVSSSAKSTVSVPVSRGCITSGFISSAFASINGRYILNVVPCPVHCKH